MIVMMLVIKILPVPMYSYRELGVQYGEITAIEPACICRLFSAEATNNCFAELLFPVERIKAETTIPNVPECALSWMISVEYVVFFIFVLNNPVYLTSFETKVEWSLPSVQNTSVLGGFVSANGGKTKHNPFKKG